MATEFIDLDKIQVPDSQVKNFSFVKNFCKTTDLKVSKIIFDDKEYSIVIYCFDNFRNHKLCFNFEDGIPLIYRKEVEDANK